MSKSARKTPRDAGVVLPLRRAAGRHGSGPRLYRDVAEVITALDPDYPVYCFCRGQLEYQVHLFRDYFPGTLAYAVKANPAPLVVGAIVEAGVRLFDVASVAEIALIRGIAPRARMLYDNPVKSRSEILQAYSEYNVRSFAVDDAEELEKIHGIIGTDSDVQISVRFKLPNSTAVVDLSRKFGAGLDTAKRLVNRVTGMGYQPALTFHPGSQCTSPEAFARHIEAASRIAVDAGTDITMLNVGGGFPAPYSNSPVPPLVEYLRTVDEAYRANFDPDRCRLVCEPGRALVAASASLLCRVKHRRRDKTVFLNDGIYGGMMEQHLSKMAMPVRVYRGGFPLCGTVSDFEVFGPTCDSTDRLPYPLHLPDDIAEGDWIEFGLMGAYGSATATRFNGYGSDQYVEVMRGFTLS